MQNSHSKRLGRMEGKLRGQLADVRARLANGVLDGFQPAEYIPMMTCWRKWMDVGKPVQLGEHFTVEEIALMHRVEVVLAQPPMLTLLESMRSLDTALAACERIRN